MYRIVWTTPSGGSGQGQFIFQTEKQALAVVKAMKVLENSSSGTLFQVESDCNCTIAP